MGNEADKARRASDPSLTLGEQFSNVDSAADASPFVTYLDRVAERARDFKRAGYNLLELKPGDAVLDVGCGPGTDVFGLEAIVGAQGRAVGVDASAAMIDEARRRAAETGSRAEFMLSPGESLPFPDGTFDAVRTERVLMHVADAARAVRELARVSKPGGRVLTIEPDHQMSSIDAADGELGDALFRGLHASVRSPRIGRQLRALFLRAGLTEVDLRVVAHVITSWADFKALTGFVEGLPETAVAKGLASEAQVRSLLADLEARDAEGCFFGCFVFMRCKGVRPR